MASAIPGICRRYSHVGAEKAEIGTTSPRPGARFPRLFPGDKRRFTTLVRDGVHQKEGNPAQSASLTLSPPGFVIITSASANSS